MTYTKQNGLEKEKLPKLRIVAFFFQESSHQVLPSETQIAFLFEIKQLRWPLWCFFFFYPSQELTATPSNHKIWNAIDIVFLRQVSSIPSAVNGWLIPRIHEGELISPTSLVLFGRVCDCTGISASVTNSLTQSDTLQRFESIRINLTVLRTKISSAADYTFAAGSLSFGFVQCAWRVRWRGVKIQPLWGLVPPWVWYPEKG